MNSGVWRKLRIPAALALVTILAGSAVAIASAFLVTGTVDRYEFGGYGPGYAVPGTVQFQGFSMQPGETVPWHYHKGTSYVILTHGTLTEQHAVGPDKCEFEEEKAGSAFVENPGEVHSVTNTGNDVAVIWWVTVYPKSDGPGGIYFADAPNCN